MTWTDREQKVWDEIRLWEIKFADYQATDIELTINKWIDMAFNALDPEIKAQFFQKIDTWLFHLHAIIQNSQLRYDDKERLLTEARLFNNSISTVEDLKSLSIDELTYIASRHIGKHRLVSFVQGGMSGTGGVFLGVDLPLLAAIQLHSIQWIGTVYGNVTDSPYEMMNALKVFHSATMPKRFRGEEWANLKSEAKKGEFVYFYEGEEELTDETWLRQPMIQIFKVVVLMMMKKKVIKSMPIFSMALGAGLNYRLSREVTDFAHRYYQYRYLIEKQ